MIWVQRGGARDGGGRGTVHLPLLRLSSFSSSLDLPDSEDSEDEDGEEDEEGEDVREIELALGVEKVQSDNGRTPVLKILSASTSFNAEGRIIDVEGGRYVYAPSKRFVTRTGV